MNTLSLTCCCAQIQVVRSWGNEHIYVKHKTRFLDRAMSNTRAVAHEMLDEDSKELSRYDVVCAVNRALEWYPSVIINGLEDMFLRWSKLDVWTSRKDEFAVSAAVVRVAAVKKLAKTKAYTKPYSVAVKEAFREIPLTTAQKSYDSHMTARVLLELVDDVIVLEYKH